MLSFFSSSASNSTTHKADAVSIFSDDDIKSVFEDLRLQHPQNDETSHQAVILLHSKSKDGLLQRAEVVKTIRRRISIEEGRISVSSLAACVDTEESDIQQILQSENDVFTSSDKEYVLSTAEQKHIVSLLESKVKSAFVNLSAFYTMEKINHATMSALLEQKQQAGQDRTLEYHSFGTTRFCASPSLVSKFKARIKQDMQLATEKKEEHMWHKDDLNELSLDCVRMLANAMLSEQGIAGSLTLKKELLWFTPQSYLEQEKYQRGEDLINGKIPSIPVTDFPQKILNATKDYSKSHPPPPESTEPLIPSSPFFLAGGHVISSRYMGNELSIAIAKACSDGFVDLQSVLTSLPAESWPEVLLIVQNEAVRRSQGTVAHVAVSNQYIVGFSWLAQKNQQTRDIASKLASIAWDDDTHIKLKGSTLKNRLRDEVSSSLKLEPPLFNLLWKDSQQSLSKEAVDGFNLQLTALERQNEQEFRQFWRSRVDDKARIYLTGARNLTVTAETRLSHGDSLRASLEDLLRIHLATDLIPSTAARAEARGLLRSSHLKLPARLTKLQTFLAEPTKDGRKEDIQLSMEALESFNEQIGISKDDQTEIHLAKKITLQDMLKTMRKDQDAPRLFLSLVIIIVASKCEGVVYATGKFAPKLLKQVKDKLDPALVSRLDQLKEAIKSGKITDAEREEMRSMAVQVADKFES